MCVGGEGVLNIPPPTHTDTGNFLENDFWTPLPPLSILYIL